MLLIGILIAASVGAPANTAPADPVENSKRGELLCIGPNTERKTCKSISAYKQTGPGTYINTSVFPLGNDATFETRTPVVIKGDAVCGSVTREDVLSGMLRVKNQVLPTETAKPMLERIAQVATPFFHKEICTRFERSGAEFTAKGSIDGVYQPDKDAVIKWIRPTDGYVVAQTQQPYRTEILPSTPQLKAMWMQAAKCGMTNGGYGFSWIETQYGIYILAVAPGSRAEAAGLKSGQQVISVNGESTFAMSRNQFNRLIHSRPAAGFNLKFHDAADIYLPPL